MDNREDRVDGGTSRQAESTTPDERRATAPSGSRLRAEDDGAQPAGESVAEASADNVIESGGQEETAAGGDDADSAPEGEEVPPAQSQPTYVETLERRLLETQDQLREYIQAYKKLKEDNSEFRSRLEREAEKDLALLRGKVVSELFEVADNLDRSIAGAEAHWDAEAFLAGIKMVRAQFLEKLEALGLEIIAPVGEKFDPNEAEAVALVSTSDPQQDDMVVDVFARGYRMDGRVIRPAKVSVAKLSEE